MTDNGEPVTPMDLDAQGNRVPVPDPTKLTTEALDKAMDQIRVEIVAAVHTREREVGKEFEHVHEKFDLFENALERRLHTLQELLDEKLSAVDQRFRLQEDSRVEQKKDTKDAVDAALTAQKEAVKEQTTASSLATQKSETATNKSLDQLATTFAASADSLRRSIDEVKERATEEARNLRASIAEVSATANSYGQQKQGGTDTRALMGWALAAVVGLVGIAGFIIDVVTR